MATNTPIIVNSGSTPFKSILTITGVVIGGGLLVYGGIELKKYFAKVKDANDLKKDQNSTITVAKGKKLFDLNGKPIQSANLGTIAADLKDALSFPVDNARAVRVFRSTPFGYVKKLEDFYLDRYGENLRERMVSKLNDASWISIKYNFR